MSVLSKIGQVLLKVGSIASEIMGFPFIGQLLGGTKAGAVVATTLGDFNSVAQILSFMEAAYPSLDGAKTGSQKLNAAAPLVAQIVLVWAQSNLPGHNKLKVDAAVFADRVKALTSAFADLLNSFGD